MAASFQDPKDLIPIIPYCKGTHGRFYEMAKGNTFEDTTIIYPEVLKVLMENGSDGYICIDEGQRNRDIPDVDEIDEIRRNMSC
jgi:hypothetical protein